MHPTIRNILSVLAALMIGSIVNMSIIKISGSLIPPPEGSDLTTPEGLAAAMNRMEAKHFIMPFLAHALGTLVGAFAVVKLAVSSHMAYAFGVGVFFSLGGIAMVNMLPSPLTFNIIDLVGAYIPMAYLGGKLAKKA